MEVLTIMATGTLCIVCFFIGSKLGQKVARGETIEAPKTIAQHFQEHREKKEAERKKNRLDTILKNIENYDGTDAGQEDVPR